MPIRKNKNEKFFKKWSPKMAYVLGFFAADGCMVKNNRGAHFIEFHITDKGLLFEIRKLLGSDHKISTRQGGVSCKTIYRLQIGSKIMFKDLLILGLTPSKSKTITLPDVSNEYFSHFVRGYFDGDGNVYANEYRRSDRKNRLSVTLLSGFTSGSKYFLEELHGRLKELANIKGGTLYCRKDAYRLYYSVNDSKKLYNFIYNRKGNLFLYRKKKVFEKFFRKTRKNNNGSVV